MKRFALFLTLVALACLPSLAANTTTTVKQVTGTVTLSNDVDYHITSAEPFTTTGSINITNTDHAVIFLDNIKPSAATDWLTYITIDGEAAAKDKNCQIRIYNQGALILPYGPTDRPLTVYSEENFGGESCSDFGFGNSGGYMNTLRANQLNNQIKSFKLRRGYMVTFAIGAQGRGYSRCFIADKEDLEMSSLPKILSGRISSYRLFKWQNTSKKGVADMVNSTLTNTLNATWSYTWSGGSSLLPDAECVPHHIYENWPSAASLGSATYSCHIKTNNEPRNSADDHPNTLDEILANWEDLMRTGMRLLTPSSWDGTDYWNGTGFIKQFLDSIDARGWRCDVVDAHCYWPESNFGNLTTWYNTLKRPIWISEFVWGASWNSNGAFANGVTEAQNKDAMARIWTKLNGMDCVERYAYWNSERDPSRIYKNGSKTAAGEYFANMNTGAGYDGKHDFVPKTPPVKSPSGLELSYAARSGDCTLKWTEPNPELLDSMVLEVKVGNGRWERQETVTLNETSTSFTLKFNNTTAGSYAYRIASYGYDGKTRYTNEAYNILTGAETVSASTGLQTGTVSTSSSAESYCFFAEPYTDEPVIVFGSVSNYNANTGLVERIKTTNYSNRQYRSFTANVLPLTYGSQTDYYRGASFSEYTSYLVVDKGTGTIGSLPYEATVTPAKQVGDTVSYTFTQTFDEAPVVMVTPVYTADTYPLLWRVFDVTPTGCRIVLQRQSGTESLSKLTAKFNLLAIGKGRTKADDGLTVIVGDSTYTFTSGTALQQTVEYGDTLESPRVLVQMQTLNRKIAGVLRTKTKEPGETGTTVRMQLDYSDKSNNTISSSKPATERLGWIAIGKSDWEEDVTLITGTEKPAGQLIIYPAVVEQAFGVRDDMATAASIHAANGQLLKTVTLREGQATVDATQLPAGIYVVRTNANHSSKIIKK